jgi:hypothetical protein
MQLTQSLLIHSYCTNYYSQKAADAAEVCDWCLTEERSSSKQGITQSKKLVISTEKIKQIKVDREETVCRGKSITPGSSSSSSKATVRRYKLLKDVLC